MTDQALTTTETRHPPAATHDFGGSGIQPYNPNINAGSVAIEEARAIAEVRGQIIIAQQFQRSVARATADFLESCKSGAFAEKAFYSVPNRGSGPSIRFAEEAARCFGNFQYGHRELSRTETRGTEVGKSEIEVYAWDVQANNRSTRQITVMHTVDTKQGPKLLKDQTDIDNRIANVASKQMRGRILALLPKGMVAEGETMAKRTLAGGNDKPMAERVTTMVQVFTQNFGVTAEMLATYIGHSLDNITLDELAELRGVAEALRDGGKPGDYFGTGEVADEPQAGQNAKIDGAAAKKPAPAKKAEPKPTEQKPAETKPADPPVETKPVETPPADPATTPPPAQDEQEQQQEEPPHEEDQTVLTGTADAAAPAPAPTPAPAPETAPGAPREAMF